MIPRLIQIRRQAVIGEVEAQTYEDAPGLAIHETVGYLADLPGPSWTITHIRSGLLIFQGLLSPEQAHECAKELAGLIDWTQDADSLRRTMLADQARYRTWREDAERRYSCRRGPVETWAKDGVDTTDLPANMAGNP